MVRWVEGTKFRYFPPIGYEPPWIDPWVSIQIAIAASFVLGLAMMAYITRLSRSSMLEVMREDFVRTARTKGLHERVVIVRHTLRGALLPVLTLSMIHLGSVRGGTTVIEQVFGINGIGRPMVYAVIRRNVIVVQNIVILLAFFFIIINLIADLIHGWLDPRVRVT